MPQAFYKTLCALIATIILVIPLKAFAAVDQLSLLSLDRRNLFKFPTNSAATFIAVGFHPKAQAKLEQSLLAVQQLQKAGTSITLAEIPVIDQKQFPDNALVRTFMKKQIINKSFISYVYPYFTNLSAFQKKLGLAKNDYIVYLLTNTKGQIIWQKKSALTPQDLTQIGQLIN